MIVLFHYQTNAKYRRMTAGAGLKPTAPFNPRITEEDWGNYAKKFLFPITKRYTCAFFEAEPAGWKEHGLFDLLMEEFAGGDHLLELRVDDREALPILVREHRFHSPKEYGLEPHIWSKREIRDSRPDLRNKWYDSAIPLRNYDFSYVCPEVLVPFEVPLSRIKRVKR